MIADARAAAIAGRQGRVRKPGLAVTSRGLVKRFGENEVLRGLDLSVPAGQFLAIVGRSGCSKSTVLRMLAGLDAPSGGDLRFGADDALGASRDSVRVMFQEHRLLPWARVRGNVEIGLGVERASPQAAARARPCGPSTSRNAPASGRRCCQAGRSSASRWHARSSAGRACSLSMSP